MLLHVGSERCCSLVRVACFATLLFSLGSSGVVHAAGIEDTVTGAEGLGRAANYGRVHDFMAVIQNPANLALATNHVGGELRFPWLRGCFRRSPNSELASEYRQTESGVLLEHFGEVCNEAFSTPTGNLGMAMGFDHWGFGLGFFTPAAVGNFEYGTDTLITQAPQPDEPGTITSENAGLESPNRYLGLKRRGITGFLMAGVGAQPNEHLRLGVSIGAGMVQLQNKTVVSVIGGSFNDPEIISEQHVTDWLVGRATGSIVLTPVQGFELFGVFQYQGDARAKGSMEVTTNGIDGAPLRNCRQPEGQPPGSHCKIDGVTLDIPFVPMEMTMGLRYAKLREGVEETARDTLRDEVFDIEAEVVYSKTSNVDEFRLNVFDEDDQNPPRVQFGNTPNAQAVTAIQEVVIPKRWKDTWTVRVGGDVNLVPGRLALRTGASYATSAQRTPYMNIDFWPVQKVTAHFGMTIGLSENDLMHLGYAHVFYQKVTVQVGEGRVTEIASQQPDEALAVNEGSYNAVQDIFSLGLQHNF